jgi:hypothetical protein
VEKGSSINGPTDKLRHRKFRLGRVQWSMALPSVVRSKPHGLRITAETENAKPMFNFWSCQSAVCSLPLLETDSSKPRSGTITGFPQPFSSHRRATDGQALKALRPADRILGSLSSSPPMHYSVLCLLLLLSNTLRGYTLAWTFATPGWANQGGSEASENLLSPKATKHFVGQQWLQDIKEGTF